MVQFRDAQHDLIFAALGNGVRRRMTESLLRSGPQAMSELARPFGISLPGAKKHIAVLEAAGLVSCAKKGRENICSVNPAALQSAAEWFAFQSKFWNASFDRLEKLLQRR